MTEGRESERQIDRQRKRDRKRYSRKRKRKNRERQINRGGKRQGGKYIDKDKIIPPLDLEVYYTASPHGLKT